MDAPLPIVVMVVVQVMRAVERHVRASVARARGYAGEVRALRRIAIGVMVVVAVVVAGWLFVREDLQRVRREIRRSAAAAVPALAVDAFVAAEDPCHWEHARFHTLSTISRSWLHDSAPPAHASLANGLVRHQVSGRGLRRLFREVLLVSVIEATEDPAVIANAYAASAYLGSIDGRHVYGIRDAARSYYGKDAAELDLAECVALAAAARSPRMYAPTAQTPRAIARRREVAQRVQSRR